MTREEYVSNVECDRWKIGQCVDLLNELVGAVAESGLRSTVSDIMRIKESVRVRAEEKNKKKDYN